MAACAGQEGSISPEMARSSGPGRDLDEPAVLVGERLAKRLPLTAIRWIAAAVFIATGVVTMLGAPGRPV